MGSLCASVTKSGTSTSVFVLDAPIVCSCGLEVAACVGSLVGSADVRSSSFGCAPLQSLVSFRFVWNVWVRPGSHWIFVFDAVGFVRVRLVRPVGIRLRAGDCLFFSGCALEVTKSKIVVGIAFGSSGSSGSAV